MNRVLCSSASAFLVRLWLCTEQQYEKPLTPVTLYKLKSFSGEARPAVLGDSRACQSRGRQFQIRRLRR